MVETDDFGVSGIITIVVAALLAAAMLPPAVSSATSADFTSRATTVELQSGETYNLSDVNTSVTLDSVDATGNDMANYTFANGDTATVSLAEGENATVTVDSKDYDINVSSVDTTDDSATASVSYEVESGGIASNLWFMVPMFMVLAVMLLFVGFVSSGRSDL